jgi:Zn-dependent M28 family amino/carboxypeptidase
LIGAHWDTRPWADADPDSSVHDEPILGANDGASGVAVLLEIANALASRVPVCAVDLAFFDAEDLGGRDGQQFALGSAHYVSVMREPPSAVIVIDLIGDRDLDIPVERYSQDLAPALVKVVWDAAGSLGISQFRDEPHKYILDDHVPFLGAGVPAVDIIDIEYEYWHTLDDTPDKCSPASLDAVGTLLLHLLYSPEGPFAGSPPR